MQNLNEGLISNLLRDTLKHNNYFNPGRLPNTSNTSGFDSANRNMGATSYPMGVPSQERHRIYFGMSTKPTDFRS